MNTLEVSETIKTGTVSAEEINKIINGGELLRVTNDDLEDIFDLNKARKSILFSFAPILNHSNSTISFIFSIVGAIACAIIAFNTDFNIAGVFAAIAEVSIFAGIGGLIGLIVSIDSKTPKDILENSSISLFVLLASAGIIYAISGQSWQNNGAVFLTLLTLIESVILISLVINNLEFAKTSVSLSREKIYINKPNMPYSAENYEKFNEYLQQRLYAWAIPKSIIYTITNQYLINDSWHKEIYYIKPIYDKNVSRKEQERLAKDPAIVMVNRDGEHLVGAWDVNKDITELNGIIKTETDKDVQNALDIRSKLNKRQFAKIVNIMRAKNNSEIK